MPLINTPEVTTHDIGWWMMTRRIATKLTEEKRPQRYDRSYSHSEKSGPFQMATKTFHCEK